MRSRVSTLGYYSLAAGLAVVLFCGASSAPAIPAFPGAEGYGAVSTGGRGGDVYHVTNLNDSGPGSFRNGVTTAGTITGRTIVFDVSGTITCQSELLFERKKKITVAGQTAPAGGITFAGQQSRVKYCDNMIIRYVRFRAGDTDPDTEDALWLYGASDTIIDHCSASWSLDEVLSSTGHIDTSKPQPNNPRITVQNCFIAEALNPDGHSYGSLLRPEVDYYLSFHHNLYESNWSRNPRPGSNDGATLHFDFRNNVIYNWGDQAGYGCYADYVPPNTWTWTTWATTSSPAVHRQRRSEPGLHRLIATPVAGSIRKATRSTATSRRGLRRHEHRLGDVRRLVCARWARPSPMPPITTQTADDALTSVLGGAGRVASAATPWTPD